MPLSPPFFTLPFVITSPLRGAVVVLAITLLYGCGVNSLLGRAENNCNRLPTPDARATCVKQSKDEDAAYRASLEREKTRAKEAQSVQDGADAKKDSLCFKRAATGEMACPN